MKQIIVYKTPVEPTGLTYNELKINQVIKQAMYPSEKKRNEKV